METLVISIIILSVLVLLSAWRINRIERKNEEFDEFLNEITDLLNRLSIEDEED